MYLQRYPAALADVGDVRKQFDHALGCCIIAGGEIKGGTQVFDDMDCVLCERERERFAKSELMVFVNAVRIRLSDKLV